MTNRNDILNELRELGSNLSAAPFENIYSVPVGYFEGFASQVFARIKALEATEAKDELNILSPYLNNLSKENPFKTPIGYFDGLEERMMNLVRTSADYQTSDEELESLSPLLQSLKKENPYTIPLGYFENLSAPVVEKTKVVFIPILKQKVIIWKSTIELTNTNNKPVAVTAPCCLYYAFYRNFFFVC